MTNTYLDFIHREASWKIRSRTNVYSNPIYMKIWSYFLSEGKSINSKQWPCLLYVFHESHNTSVYASTFISLIGEVSFHLMKSDIVIRFSKQHVFVTTEHGNIQNMTSKWRLSKYSINVPRLVSCAFHPAF